MCSKNISSPLRIFSSQYSRGYILEDTEAEPPHLTSKINGEILSLSSLNTKFIAKLTDGEYIKANTTCTLVCSHTYLCLINSVQQALCVTSKYKADNIVPYLSISFSLSQLKWLRSILVIVAGF